jgi:hypothetical protein
MASPEERGERSDSPEAAEVWAEDDMATFPCWGVARNAGACTVRVGPLQPELRAGGFPQQLMAFRNNRKVRPKTLRRKDGRFPRG